jgi:hypothetical protein
MRAFFLALVSCLAAPAVLAQQQASTPELSRAANALGAVWRPIERPFTGDGVRAACAGAAEEIEALDAAMPSELTAESVARVRGLRGLHIIPLSQTPGAAYYFPPLGLTWFSSGLGSFSVISEAEGFIGLIDAAGHDIAVQIGRAGNHPILMLRPPQGEPAAFVGCQPIAPLDGSEPR